LTFGEVEDMFLPFFNEFSELRIPRSLKFQPVSTFGFIRVTPAMAVKFH